MTKIKKSLKVFKNNGLVNGSIIILKKIMSYIYVCDIVGPKKDLFKFYEYIYFKKNEPKLSIIETDKIKILWFIPDFSIGSGGHLNIFRMILNLYKLGIKSDIAICGNSQWVNESIAKETIDKHFCKLDSKITILEEKKDIRLLSGYTAGIATSWQTAYYVNYFDNCSKKIYFVQDYEPYFYPAGSGYIFAKNTYRF
jgi:hypothetical protein